MKGYKLKEKRARETINRREAYWRRRVKQEQIEMMRGHESVASVPPNASMVLLARRQLTIGNKVFPRGAVVNPADVKNLQACLDGRILAWGFPSENAPSPRDLPPPPAPTPRPAIIEIVDAGDPLSSWYASVELMKSKCSGNEQMAKELLHSIPEGRQLFRDAVRIATAAKAKSLKMQSCPAVRL